MPEEDIAVPGVGRRLLIFIVTLLLLYCNPHCSVTARRLPVALHVRRSTTAIRVASEYLISYAFGYVAINLGKMCSFLKRSAYL